MSLSNYAETEMMEWAFGEVAPATAPTLHHIALHTADPTETGATAECAYAGYARQPASFSVTGGVATTTNSQTFPAVAGSSITISHFSVWDAATTGNCLAVGALDLAKLFAVADVPKFGTGEIVITLD